MRPALSPGGLGLGPAAEIALAAAAQTWAAVQKSPAAFSAAERLVLQAAASRLPAAWLLPCLQRPLQPARCPACWNVHAWQHLPLQETHVIISKRSQPHVQAGKHIPIILA